MKNNGDKLMFIRNTWYVAALAHEVQGVPLARTLLEEDIVLYRQGNGTVAALEDRCCHRGLPLAHGSVVGNDVQCGYHGLVFDASGQCVRVPGQERVPVKARVKTYPVVERDGLVWIWLGEPGLAEPDDIMPYPWHTDPGWAYRGKCNAVDAPYLLLYDNLLDLTHVGYVHRQTIGGDPESHSNAEMKVTPTDDGVHIIRWLRNSKPPPTYVQAYGFQGNVDRWIEINFVPGAVQIYAGAKDAGKGAYEGDRRDSLGLRTLHAVTPSTRTSTLYFWTAAHNFKVDQPAVTDQVYRQMAATFEEDKLILESQFQRLSQDPDRPLVDIASDVGAIQARRIIDRRLAREQAMRTAPARVHHETVS